MKIKNEEYSILNIGMLLEVYTDKKYSHDDVECGCFAEACLFVLEKNNATEKNGELVDRLNQVKGKSCREIGEEKCRELFLLVRNEVKGKKKPIIKIIVISLSVLILAALVFTLIYLPNYIKNKTFNNGIQGKYYCTDTLVTLAARAEGYSESACDDYFIGKSITIDENGILSGLVILDDCQLKFADDYFSFDKSYILYKPEDEYKGNGGSPDDFFVHSVDFHKKGSQVSADKYAETDQIELYIAVDDVNANFAFVLTLEKLE
ncbi:MAG: hypothetical protein ACI4JQ_03050 [Ruminococcus sp.]